MATYMQGALKSGDTPSEYGAVGYALFAKSTTLQAASAATVDGTISVPKNSQLVSLLIDNTVAWTASGAVTLTIGVTAGGTEYVTSADLKTVTRPTITFTAAQLAAMANVGNNVSVVCRATTASGANATGTTIVTAVYAPKQ